MIESQKQTKRKKVKVDPYMKKIPRGQGHRTRVVVSCYISPSSPTHTAALHETPEFGTAASLSTIPSKYDGRRHDSNTKPVD